MSTMEATISMLEAMPEEARIKVMEYTQRLSTANKPATPFIPASSDEILSDLEESRQQIASGQGLNMKDTLKELGKCYGFV